MDNSLGALPRGNICQTPDGNHPAPYKVLDFWPILAGYSFVGQSVMSLGGCKEQSHIEIDSGTSVTPKRGKSVTSTTSRIVVSAEKSCVMMCHSETVDASE